MSNHWTEAKLFKFLRLYKRYECLWNPYSPEYRNYDAKSKAFSQILCEINVFGLTIGECLNQIKYVRKTYKQEQQRLGSLALLGGRSYSNLLWYPIVNSMLSKVIQDEEKLTRTIGNLDLIVAPNCSPFDSGDQWTQRNLNPPNYSQNTSPWDENETSMICQYLLNSGIGSNMNCYPNPNILNDSFGMYAPNEHISSCPTCGYSNGSPCGCFPMSDVGYHPDDIGRNIHSSHSQINYRPRTSYNYSNGILEINSAVRIPVSQPSPNCGYSNLMESILPEEPEYNSDTISSDHNPEIETLEQGEASSPECCSKTSHCKNEKNKVRDGYKSQETFKHVDNTNSNPANFPSNKNGAWIKNINKSLKKSKKTKSNIDELLRAQKVASINPSRNSIRKTIKVEKIITDNKTSLPNIDRTNFIHDGRQSSGVSSKKLLHIKPKILPLDPQQHGTVNLKAEEASRSNANSRVEDMLTVESGNEQPKKENVCSVISACNENTSDVETTQDLVQKSKSILKHNLTKIVIDFIDETLKNPDEESPVNAEDRLILKKVAKDLRALKNRRNCTCDVELMKEKKEQSKQNGNIKFCNKTICWREPIEESLNVSPCKSITFSADETNLKENVPVQSSKHLNENRACRYRMMAGADSDVKDTECPLIIDHRLSQSDESIDLQLASQGIGIDGRIIMIDSSSNTKNGEDQIDHLKHQSPRLTPQDRTAKENSVTIHISVGSSDSSEDEIVDKVVNKITHVLQKTLDENGYAIEKRDFFTKKNLITNGNGEINQKLIGNETVWRTELKNIIGQLMENNKVDDSITFKVKTTILPIDNSSNVIAEGVANLTSSLKTRQKFLPSSIENYESKEKPNPMAEINKQFKDLHFDALLYKANRHFQFNKQSLETQIREFSKRKKNVTHSELDNPNIKNRIVLPNNDYPKALWKQLRYFVKHRDRFENIPRKCTKSPRNHQHEYALKNDANLAEDPKNNYDLVAANFGDKLPLHFSKDIDVYLCTEISEEEQSPMRKTTGKREKCPDSNILCEVQENSLSTDISTKVRRNAGIKSTVNSCVETISSSNEEDGSEWESFSDSDEETVIVKQSFQCQNKFSRQLSKRGLKGGNSNHRSRYSSDDYFLGGTFCEKNYPEVYALTNRKKTKNKFLYQKRAEKLELPDAIIQPFDKDRPITSQANELKNIPNPQNNCKIVDAISSNQNISREELATSGKLSEASLCCELEAQEANEHPILNPNESEEGESLLEAKLKIAAINPSNLCCAEDETHSAVCTPICDISSRLRLCAILKSPNEIRSKINRNNLSDNILCCCDGDDKLKTTDVTYSRHSIEPSRENFTVGDTSVGSMTQGCQTILFDRHPNILKEEIHASSQKPNRENSIGYSLQINRNKACTEKSANVQSNTQDSVFGGESLILEIKMLQPLFSIEVKKGCRESDKEEVLVEQNSRESVIESSSKNAVTSPVPPSENHIEESTSVTPDNYGLQKIDTCGTRISQICKMDSDVRETIATCSDRSTSSTSIASRENKKDASTSFEEKCDCPDLGQCNMLLESFGSLKDYQISHETSMNEFSVNDSVQCSEKALSQLRAKPIAESESMTLETLIKMIESGLPHITDHIIHQKLVDTIEYIKNKDQDFRKHSSNEIYPQAKISQTSKSSLEKKVMEAPFESKEKSIISITEAGESHKPCKLRAVDTANCCRNDRGTLAEVKIEAENESLQSEKAAPLTLQVKMEGPTIHTTTEKEVANQASSNASLSMLPIAGNSYSQSERSGKACDHEIEARTSQISQILENEDSNDTCCAAISRPNNERSGSQEDSHLMNTLEYSSNEISCPLEQTESYDSNSDQSINGALNMTPKAQNVENYEYSKNFCRHGESMDVDINAFANTVATQLRELSTEAALRSQQRIQTLIGNSRLESEKNKKSR